MDQAVLDKGVTPPAGSVTPPAQPVQPTPAPEPPDDTDGVTPPPSKKQYSADYVAKITKENADRRAREAELEARLKTFEDEKLSEKEKAERDLQEARDKAKALEERTQKLLLDGLLKDAALEAGASAQKTGGILRLVDTAHIEYDIVTGEPTEASIKAAIASVKSEYPELFGTPGLPNSGSPNNPPRTVGTAQLVDPRNPWAGATWKD